MPHSDLIDLRTAIERLQRQAFEYASFMKRYVAAEGKVEEREPPPISLKAIEILEGRTQSVFLTCEVPFRTWAEYKKEYRQIRPEPDGGLFGTTAAGYEWTYCSLHLWLDEMLARSYTATATSAERILATNYHLNISNVTGPVNILSHLNHAVQAVQTADGMKEGSKEKIVSLLEELRVALAGAPAAQLSDAELVAEQASDLAEEFSRQKPRQSALNIKASGLVEAANSLKSVVPTAIAIAKQIAASIDNPDTQL
ncbi:hypothetical protein LMG28727_00839 [Paraburkholderia kirstenboschensis]|uniref:hypothetical protein n=1 Tax=Paraburkholderia kirstenboschensis TaxID=1245436 RepID=UPI000A54E790|nr:hypothetical protein [Paraburkholderia kirstenboschensis]CAD6514103.1 hypothetical protein LMG28727_00839 [Paraburkholderia kirstenboschensis]